MKTAALIIVDMQKDFCEGGALAVKDANSIIPIINKIREENNFNCVVLTEDYHPYDHISFISSPLLSDNVELTDLTKKWKVSYKSY